MGSRLMHAAIATLLMAKCHQLDTAFLIGNEAPDVDKINQMTKDETHYLVPSNRGTRRVDLRAFLQDHPETLSDSFTLGYYTHLLADEVWLTDVFMKVVPPQDDPRRPAVLERYYEDFKKLIRILFISMVYSHYQRQLLRLCRRISQIRRVLKS